MRFQNALPVERRYLLSPGAKSLRTSVTKALLICVDMKCGSCSQVIHTAFVFVRRCGRILKTTRSDAKIFHVKRRTFFRKKVLLCASAESFRGATVEGDEKVSCLCRFQGDYKVPKNQHEAGSLCP
jgi:hypothetical protein